MILMTGVLCAGLAFGYAYFFIVPTYSASVQMYVNNNYADSPGFSSSQITAAQDLADTYMVILKSRNVLVDVIEQTGLNYTYAQLRNMVSAYAVNETEVFEVRVISTNYKHAAIFANAIADILPAKIAAVVDGSSVRVVDRAVENPSPVGPNYRRYLLLGALAGVVLSAAFVIVINLMDTSISSEEFLAQVHGKYPLLAVIPSTNGSHSGGYKGYKSYRGYYETEKSRTGNDNGGADA